MRLAVLGMAMVKQQFMEDWGYFSPSTWALTCLLHDIGTSDDNMAATRMSFEFYGGILALRLLREDFGAPQDQAEAVCEAIIRHQDLGHEGNITFLGQVIQLATVYDNVGAHPEVPDLAEIVHESTRRDINKQFPRKGWLVCFADVIRREEGSKPWCNTTRIPEFDRMVLGNELMMPFD